MNNVPLEIFFPVTALFLVVPLIAYFMRTDIYSSMVFFICGAVFLVFVMSIDGIAYANLPTNSTDVGDTTFYEFEQLSYGIRNSETLEPTNLGIGLIFIGVILILVGVLMEVKR